MLKFFRQLLFNSVIVLLSSTAWCVDKAPGVKGTLESSLGVKNCFQPNSGTVKEVCTQYTDAKNAEIRDSRGRSIALTWTPKGRVSTAKTADTELTYTYDAAQDLRKSAIKGGLNFRYSYDDNHNLTQIMHVDDTKMTIDYFRKTGRVVSVTERNREPVFYGSNIELGDPEPLQKPIVEPFDPGDIAFEADDFTTALREWKALADKNPAAQLKLAMLYYKGNGVTQDPDEAQKGIRKSADAGYSKGQTILGMMYERGEIVAESPKEALRWYRMAADQNDVEAQMYLGLMYWNGAGVAKDLAEAARWYRKAADLNYSDAQFILGQAYFRGEGVPTNRYEAVVLIGKAAHQGQIDAMYQLGAMFADGIGVGMDSDKAKAWYRKAADQGHVKAELSLKALMSDD